MPTARERLASALTDAERAVDRRLGATLLQRPGWQLTVIPYVGHGTPARLHMRGRAVARRQRSRRPDGPAAVLLTAVGRYLSAEVAGAEVTVEVGGRSVRAASDAEGYVNVDLDVELSRVWHPVTFSVAG